MALTRASNELKNKTNVNPSVDRTKEATAEDFNEVGVLFDEYADAIEANQAAQSSNPYYGKYDSLALLIIAHPTGVEDAWAIIDAGAGITPQIAAWDDIASEWGIVNNTNNITFGANKAAFPPTGTSQQWYIALDTMYVYVWNSGEYKLTNPTVANLQTQFTVADVQDDTVHLTEVAAGKIGFEFNDGASQMSGVLFNQNYTDKIQQYVDDAASTTYYLVVDNKTKNLEVFAKITGFTTVNTDYTRANLALKIPSTDVIDSGDIIEIKLHIDVEGAGSSQTHYHRKVIAIADNTSAPPTEVSGDRYILDETGGGVHADWDGAIANDIVEFIDGSWEATTPEEGDKAYVDSQDKDARFIDDGTPQWELITASSGIPTQQLAFNSVVKADKKYFSTNANKHTQTADIFFSFDNTGALIDGGYTIEIVGNGDKVYFTSDFGVINSSEVVTNNNITLQDGITYLFVFFYTGNTIDVMIGESSVFALQPINKPVITASVWDNTTDVTLTITDTNSSPNETETDVEYSIAGADTWTVHGQMAQDGTSYTVTGLSDANSYDFRVKAKITSNYFTNSDYSDINTIAPGATNIVMSDDFADNAINGAKWTVVGAQGKITEANTRLEFNINHSELIEGNPLNHYIKAIPTFNSGKIWFQFDLEQENVLADTGFIHAGLYRTSDGDNTNCIRLITDNGNAGKLKAQVFLGATKVYEVTNVGAAVGTYKIGYDVATNNITFWQLTGVDTWTQLGTTQVYDVIGDENTETITCLFAINDNVSSTAIDYAYIDNVYLSTADYATSNPV